MNPGLNDIQIALVIIGAIRKAPTTTATTYQGA